MKRFWCSLLLFAGLLLPQVSFAQEEWVIENFNSAIDVEREGGVLVQETIKVDFGSSAKHGIFRDLPHTYTDASGRKIYTRISDIDVTQDGAPAETDITRNQANLRIRIGDPDEIISGRHEYGISYRVAGVLQAFEGFDELNWNVTGSMWEVPIQHAEATVTVPASIIQSACYIGVEGSTARCDTSEQSESLARFLASHLNPAEGLTVAVGFTPRVVPIISVDAPPSVIDVLLSPLTGITFGLAVAIGVGWWLWRWHRFGRDRYWQRAHLPGVRSDREGKNLPEKVLPWGYRKPVSVEYEPPDGLRPAEIGVLLDEQADTRDVSATIVDLAARGYLTISEIPKTWLFGKKDYAFKRTDTPDDQLLPYEKLLLERLFRSGNEVRLSALKNSFYKDLKEVKQALYKETIKKHLFADSPEKIRGIYIAVGIVSVVAGGFLLGWMIKTISQAEILKLHYQILIGLGTGLVVVGLAGVLFSRFMPRKTGYGRELYDRVLGYELFVSGTEKYRAPFFEREGIFMEVLPYEITFGVTHKLARAFKEMDIEPAAPSWFYGASAFHAADFIGSMDSFSQSLSTAIASSPSGSGSGGGGSSGGGFGGGGGGSW